jgi:ubiquinone/menaquinone biosynthesis C-methylase UbiE
MPGNDFYWGEISQEQMKLINEESTLTGNWFDVITQHLDNRPDLVQYYTDVSRLGWLFHAYKEDQNDVCVDIGSGLGSLSFQLSRFYSEVYSVDGVLDRLKFQVIRAAEEGISNIHFIRSPLFKLPFQDASVDLVVVNGVLEWVGLSDFSKHPRELQSIFLNEMMRILKPTGVLYVGIENRFGAQYLLGSKDHTNLRFTSLLPRWLASRVMLYFHNKSKSNPIYYFPGSENGYRTFTYSLRGYEKLLRQTGFKHIDSKWTLPSYSFPKFSGPTDGYSVRHILDIFSGAFGRRWVRSMVKSVSKLPVAILKYSHRLFAPDFLFFASQMPLSNTLANRLYQQFPEIKSYTRMSLDISNALNTTFHLLNSNGKIIKVLRYAEQAGLTSGQSRIAVQSYDVNDGRVFRLHQRSDIRRAANWLSHFQQETTSGFWHMANLDTEMSRLIELTRKLFAGNFSAELEEYEYIYHNALADLHVPVVTEYGNFSPQNIMIEAGGQFNVIDQDSMRERGNPLMDVGCFGFSILRSAEGERPSENDHHMLLARANRSLGWFERDYLSQNTLPIRLAPAYYLMRLFEQKQVDIGRGIEAAYVQRYWLNYLRLTLDHALSGAAQDLAHINQSLAISGSDL